jgi:hypothetical protein
MNPIAQFPEPGPIIRFSIRPDGLGGWRWETHGSDGAPCACGLSPTRRIAAALVIKHIVQARTSLAVAPAPTAKAA